MAKEVRITAGMTVRKINSADGITLIDFRQSGGFTADMTGRKGPTPGAVLAKLAANGGTQVDLSGLTQPFWCWMENLGPANGDAPTAADYVEVGIWNAQDTSFSPLMEFAAGVRLPIPLSRNVQEVFQGPGSGTSAGGETARLMLIANNKEQNFVVSAFEK